MNIKSIVVCALLLSSTAFAEDFENPVIDLSEDRGFVEILRQSEVRNAQVERDQNINNAIIFEAIKNSSQNRHINPYFNPYVNSAPVVPSGGQNGIVVNGIFFSTK